jgi:hypothetical protein
MLALHTSGGCHTQVRLHWFATQICLLRGDNGERTTRAAAPEIRPYRKRCTTDVTKLWAVVDCKYPAARNLSIGRILIEIPRRLLSAREGAASIAIKALKLRDERGDSLPAAAARRSLGTGGRDGYESPLRQRMIEDVTIRNLSQARLLHLIA